MCGIKCGSVNRVLLRGRAWSLSGLRVVVMTRGLVVD